MKKKLLILSIFLLIILGCKKENHPPVISSISVSSPVIYPESTYTFECIANDPDGDNLIYNWTCTNGTLLSTSGKTVKWKSPERSGTAIISCEVRDGKGGRDRMDKSVTIKPITITIINTSEYIEGGYAIWWKKYIKKDWTIHGYFSVAGGEGIKFHILDETNFENWRNGRSYRALVETGWSSGSNFSAVIPSTGYYYIVLDNWYTIYDKYVTLFVQITSP
jgi:hypothetical protein